MTLEQLRIFVFVAERAHMTRAAEALHITQSAASAAIAALESRYGVRLFDRVGRGLALSAAGQLFLPEAKAVLARAAAATQSLDDLAGLKRGAIAIAASQTVSNYWLPPRLARFAQAHPGVALSLTVCNTRQVAQAVSNGDAELGFVEGGVDAPDLTRSRVASDRIGLYAASSETPARAAIGVEDLPGLTWVLREPGSGTRSEFERALQGVGLDPATLQVALELPSNEAVLEAVACGGFVAPVSELAAQPWVACGRLVRLAFDLPTRAFELLTHRERRRSHAAAAFLSMG